MNKNNREIVEEMIIHNDKIMNTFNTISNGSPWKDDLYVEIILIFMRMDNEKLNELYEKGENDFNFYFACITKNQLHSSTSPFYKKYRKELDDNVNMDFADMFVTDSDEHESFDMDSPRQNHSWTQTMAEQVQDIYQDVRDELHWYDRTIFEMYVRRYTDRGTIRRIAEETGIPEQSVGNTVRNVKAHLSSRIEKLIEYDL